jgi:dynein heavy chain
LENLHLASEWLGFLEEIIVKLSKPEVNPRFRLWLSSQPVQGFPMSILSMSVKVYL